MKKCNILLLSFLLVAAEVSAQTYHQNLYWLRYQTLINFNSSWYWSNDIDNRRFFDPDVQNQLIIHSRIHYKKGNWDFGSGLTYSIAYAAIPEVGYKNPVHELRPVIEASYERSLGKVLLGQRFRIDNRIFQEEPDQSLFEESFYIMRFRYRIQARFALKTDIENKTRVGLRIADEIMFNHTENFYDQNRVYVTVEFYLSKRFTFAPEYIYIYQQRLGTEEFFRAT